MTPILSVRNLRVEIPTRQGVLTAIDDLSFDIAPGDVLGVVGESGAGKSITGSAIIRMCSCISAGDVAGERSSLAESDPAAGCPICE